MINDGVNDVPEKTIAVFSAPSDPRIDKVEATTIVKKPDKTRDWFTPHFYRCLPLAIGNQYGFYIVSQFGFAFEWNGGPEKTDIDLKFEYTEEQLDLMVPCVESHFGSGIITINAPFTFRTPPGVNLMTINPPNFFIPNITVMTGVVETDNLRRNFTFNLKIQMPNIKVVVHKGTPLAGFIPIPRYYGDKFELKRAEDIFSKEVYEEEYQAYKDEGLSRETLVKEVLEGKRKSSIDRRYLLGKDVYGNEFKDHQSPND